MKLSKIFLLLFVVFALNSVNIFSQKESRYDLKNEEQEHNLNGNYNVILFDSTSAIDSIIVSKIVGDNEIHRYSYDTTGKMVSYLIQKKWGLKWKNNTQYFYTYDSSGNMTSKIIESWGGYGVVGEVLSKHQFTYAYTLNGLITLKLEEEWNESESQWIKKRRFMYEYDANGKITMETEDLGSSEINILRNTYNYDSNGNLISQSQELGYQSSWNNYSKITYSYDSNNKLIIDLLEKWSGSQWLKKYQTTYTYDSNGNNILELNGTFDGGQLVNNYRTTNSFDSIGNNILVFKEMWEDSQWVNQYRATYNYDSNRNITMRFSEYWQGENPWGGGTYQWVANNKHIYIYNQNGNKILELIKHWSGEQFLDDYRYTYQYNSNKKLNLFLCEKWDGTNWNLSDNHYPSLNYAFPHNEYYVTINGARVEVFYKTTTSLSDENLNIIRFSLSQNYPNPFNPTTTINYSLQQRSFVQLSVYDLLGKEVAKLVNKEQSIGNYKVEFNASTLRSGIYFYRLQGDNYSETKKLILLK